MARFIAPLILADRRPGQYYVEPFVGGANMLAGIPGPRIGADANRYIIALLHSLQNGWVPPPVDEPLYQLIRNNTEAFPPELVGYAGTQLSYGGRWFGSYRRDKQGVRDYSKEAQRGALVQAPRLLGAGFIHAAYENLSIPRGSIIYCDPPRIRGAEPIYMLLRGSTILVSGGGAASGIKKGIKFLFQSTKRLRILRAFGRNELKGNSLINYETT